MEISDQETLQKYIDSTPESNLRPLLATLYLADNDYQKAIDLCREDLTLHPLSAIGHYIWALTAQAMGDIQQAVSHFQAALQNDAGFLQAYYKLTDLAQGYLTPQQLKYYYEQIYYLNPLDGETAAKLAALPADLESLAAQMQIKPSQLPEPKVSDQATTQTESTPATLEVDPLQAAGKLSEFFESIPKEMKKSTPPEPTIPEEEAHLGPAETSGVEPEAESEPTVTFDEPESSESPSEIKAGPEQSSISNLFSRLREKPLEEVQKENWMMEHLADEVEPASPPESVKTEIPADSTTKPPEKNGDKEASVIQPGTKTESADATPTITKTPPESKKSSTAKTTTKSKPKKKTQTSSSKKKSTSQTNKNDGQVNNISFPIPTWTLVDVLTKQKLFEQALSILDIIEAKSKNQDDLDKVQKNRTEIIKRMAEEQAGEA